METASGEHTRRLKEESLGRQMITVPNFEREEMEYGVTVEEDRECKEKLAVKHVRDFFK